MQAENLASKVKTYEEETKVMELSNEKLKETNSQLENRINILKEVESRNKELASECERLAKELHEAQAAIRRQQIENSNIRGDKEDLERLLEQNHGEQRELVEKFTQQSEAVRLLDSRAQELQQTMDQQKLSLDESVRLLTGREAELRDWQARYGDLRQQFDRYIVEYEQMSCKFERMSAINEDHIKDIENKAFSISQLQKRLVVQMIELARIDSLRHADSPN